MGLCWWGGRCQAAARWEADLGAFQEPHCTLHPFQLQPRPVNDVRRSMGAGAVHRLMACNYRGVIKALGSLLTGRTPAIQTPPANGCRQEDACDGAELVPSPFPLLSFLRSPLSAAVLGRDWEKLAITLPTDLTWGSRHRCWAGRAGLEIGPQLKD